MRKWLFGIAFFCIGCSVPSKIVLNGSGGRTAYNVAVQKTNSEEMLLNLVRLKYGESPSFLELSSITTQHSIKNIISASISIPGFSKANPMNLRGETQFQAQPTLQYSPLQGKDFANQILRPIDIGVIQQIIYSGWDLDRVFLLAIENFQEFPNLHREGLAPEELKRHEKFHEVIDLMKKLQMKGSLQIGVRQQTNDLKLKSLQFSFPFEDQYGKEIAEILKEEKSSNGKYIINIVQGFDENGNIGILPRSLLSCMYYLSKNVRIPEKDIKVCKTSDIFNCTISTKDIPKIFKELLIVYNSNRKPKDSYVCVKYRDTWFYIKDGDIHSKKTFLLLLDLYNLQSGIPEVKGALFTLPVG